MSDAVETAERVGAGSMNRDVIPVHAMLDEEMQRQLEVGNDALAECDKRLDKKEERDAAKAEILARMEKYKATTERLKKTYDGTFTFRRKNMGDTLQIAIRQKQLLGGGQEEEYPDQIVNVAYFCATLERGVTQGPAWWKGPEEILDYDLLRSIYRGYYEWEESFRS